MLSFGSHLVCHPVCEPVSALGIQVLGIVFAVAGRGQKSPAGL